MVEKPRPPVDDDDEKPNAAEDGAEVVAKPLTKIERVQLALQQNFKKLATFFWTREPALVPTITTLIAVIILSGLGYWQLSRLEWKNDIIRNVQQELKAPVLDMRAQHPQNAAGWEKYNYRPVIVKGTWLSVHGFKMIPRTYEGQTGYHLILPLKMADDQVIFVNRGFVPDNGKILPPDEEKVFAVQGVLKIPESHKTWATPENVPSRGVWTWVDLAAMRHEIGVNSASPMILYEARSTEQESYPIGGQLPVPIYNRHRQYAMIWFILAIAFVGIWMIASSPKEKLKPVDETAAANDDERMKDPVARRGLYPEATD